MKDNITEPLLLDMGLEGLHPIIVTAEKLLNQGVFRNLRELELKLLYDAMVASRSQEILEDFLERVITFFERTCIIIGQDPMYRVSLYTQGIDTIWHNCLTDQRFDKEWTAQSNAMSSNRTHSPTEVHSHRPSADSEPIAILSDTPVTKVSLPRCSTRPESFL